MKQRIRNEREYWDCTAEAEALQSRGWNMLTNDERNRLAELSHMTEEYEFRHSRNLYHSPDYYSEAR